MAGSKLWGGCFQEGAHQSLSDLNNSLPVDRRLYDEDLTGSLAYANALKRSQLINEVECEKIKGALEIIRNEWKSGSIELKPYDEDVHTVNERRLIELVGPEVGGKLHTGRSRNDQVTVDMRLWMKNAVEKIQNEIRSFVGVLIERAEEWIDILIPGYTHLQRAQTIRISHWLLSYGSYFESDFSRFADLQRRVDYLPLGSGAIAGNPFNIDRLEIAKELGFKDVTQNSMFAVGDRDFVVEFNFVNSLLSLHMSRMAEDLIIYSSREFGLTTISETFSTGSSLMPQKRNPDSLELVRGMSGEIFGQLTGFMMTLKGLPSTYNKDLQSDKTSMFTSFDRIMGSITVLRGVLESLQVNETNCRASLSMEMLATDIAYYLVRKGVPFRSAHHAAGQVIRRAEEKAIPLNEISIAELQTINGSISEDFQDIWDFEKSVEQYTAIGGTARKCIKEQTIKLKEKLNLK